MYDTLTSVPAFNVGITGDTYGVINAPFAAESEHSNNLSFRSAVIVVAAGLRAMHRAVQF